MPTVINGTTGVSKVQDGSIEQADLAPGVLSVGGVVAPASGLVGELVRATGSGGALPNGVVTGATSLIIPAGVWDVQVGAAFSAVTGPCTVRSASLSTEIATLGVNGVVKSNSATMTLGYQDFCDTALHRLVLTVPTQYYCNVFAGFSGGTVSLASSYINARRAA